MTAATGRLQIDGIGHSFAGVPALRDISFEVAPGEFMTFLGPSGSGKTTTLRIIAGFIAPDRGRLVLDGQDLTPVPPHRRDIGMVFQNYALFPHLSVGRNVAFPLEMRRLGAAEVRRRVEAALELVHLAGLGDRRPRQLSGGQQQRVALARALVFQPRLLLMDEPLGALDRKLREAMQLEIVRICREVGHTVLYVTHDQEEALAMSDRIAVYHEGRIEQIGTPEEMYRRPASLFVAGFVGESTTFAGRIEGHTAGGVLRTGTLALPLDGAALRSARLDPGAQAALVVRPEFMTLRRLPAATASAPGVGAVRGRVESSVYLGTTRKYVVALVDGTTAVVRVPPERADEAMAAIGDDVEVSWPIDKAILLPTERQATPGDGAVPVEPAPARDIAGRR